MKEQIKQMLYRLKKPSVILSITSQILTILVLLNVHVNRAEVTGVVTAVCSILVLLGIMSNPDSQKKGYGDDMLTCKTCGKKTRHVLVGGQMMCSCCGATHTNAKNENSINVDSKDILTKKE